MERNSELTGLARQLRKNQTKEEALLWYRFLRKYPVRFHRQYVIGHYIVDFYCHRAKLAVELDGSQHCDLKTMQYDQQRTAYLRAQGITVLRFSNLDVIRKFYLVCEQINHAVNTLSRGEGAP